jgi:hypothetical protein
VKVRKATMMLAAGLMAITPVASNAASSLSVARAVPQLSGASFLQDDEHHGRGTAVILGVVLVVLMVAAAIAGNGKGPNNPHSP